MTRDQARAAFADAGLTYEILSVEMLQELRKRLDDHLKRSGLMGGTYRMRSSCRFDQLPNGTHAALRCKSHYFDDREAVTFNPEGFIGFAGWADETKIQPILNGFSEWVEAVRISVPNPLP